ncbi:hypothetical protein Tco_0573394 [Tanacetum coccineum]
MSSYLPPPLLMAENPKHHSLGTIAGDDENINSSVINTIRTPCDKIIPFGVTSITNNIPVKLSLEKLNYNSWCSFFKIYLGRVLFLKKHNAEHPQVNVTTDPEWSKLDDLIKMWILGTCCESLLDQVISTQENSKVVYEIRRIMYSGYDVIDLLDMSILLVLNVDQGFVYGVSADLDRAYSSKSDNGLEFI